MILSAQTIRRIKPLLPIYDRTRFNGVTYGLSAAGYDIRIAEHLHLYPGERSLISAMEYFQMPEDIIAQTWNKSTWARKHLLVLNTIIEPGWHGYLTLEVANLSNKEIEIEKGTGIAQIVFTWLDHKTEQPYEGKYQNQQAGPQEAIYDR